MSQIGQIGQIAKGGSTTMGSGAWLLGLLLGLMFCVIQGLSLIWISIDRNDIAYNIVKLQQEVSSAREYTSKLEVERDILLSPHELGNKAQQLGMTMANPGQVRRLQDASTR